MHVEALVRIGHAKSNNIIQVWHYLWGVTPSMLDSKHMSSGHNASGWDFHVEYGWLLNVDNQAHLGL